MMRIHVDDGWIEQARAGDLGALERLLRQLQSPVYNLAVRMLGRRDDAQDATQEILLKVTTHLGSWRADSAFATWVWSIASHHLLNQRARDPARRETSLDELGEALDKGPAYAQRIDAAGTAASPEDLLEARRTALACMQAMLMCLDAPGRLAYVLDEIFGLASPEAAQVQGITPAAHRQRLARARRAVHGFMARRCGLVAEDAPCRCLHQLPAKRAAAQRGRAAAGLTVSAAELEAADRALRELVALGDAAAAMRGAPEYAAPPSLLRGIRLVVERSWMLRQ